jgi:hypothetical protein
MILFVKNIVYKMILLIKIKSWMNKKKFLKSKFEIKYLTLFDNFINQYQEVGL